MNWLTRLIPSIGKRKETASKSKIPDGVWNNCPSCEAILYQPELEKAMFVCPKCGYHLRIDNGELSIGKELKESYK